MQLLYSIYYLQHWRQTAKNIKAFFNDMKNPDMIAGVRLDYYVPMLICDILCFLTIAFFYSYFAVRLNSLVCLPCILPFLNRLLEEEGVMSFN